MPVLDPGRDFRTLSKREAEWWQVRRDSVTACHDTVNGGR